MVYKYRIWICCRYLWDIWLLAFELYYCTFKISMFIQAIHSRFWKSERSTSKIYIVLLIIIRLLLILKWHWNSWQAKWEIHILTITSLTIYCKLMNRFSMIDCVIIAFVSVLDSTNDVCDVSDIRALKIKHKKLFLVIQIIFILI